MVRGKEGRRRTREGSKESNRSRETLYAVQRARPKDKRPNVKV